MPSFVLLLLTYLGFISLGLPDSLLGVVWPSVYPHFGLTANYLGIVLTASVSGYLVSSLSAGRLLQSLGVGGLLAGSTALVAVALLGFAWAPAWPLFVASAVVAGLGSGAIDSGLNAYAARHFSARHMSWLHACWGVGATLGAMTATAILARNLPWPWTYGSVAVVMVGMTVLFTVFRSTWQTSSPAPEAEATGAAALREEPATMREALRHRRVQAQILVFFVYTGTEMTFATWAFTLLSQYRGLSGEIAGSAVSLFWVALAAGRFGLGAIADHVGVPRLLIACATTGLAGGLIFTLAPWPWVSIAGLALVGGSFALIYPGMMTLTPRLLGRLADHAVGFQVGSATLGQVALPSLGGVVLVAYGPAALNGLLALFVLIVWLALVSVLATARHIEA